MGRKKAPPGPKPGEPGYELTVGCAINRIIKSRGLRYNAVASAVRVSTQGLRNWRKNINAPSLEDLLALSTALDVHPGDIDTRFAVTDSCGMRSTAFPAWSDFAASPTGKNMTQDELTPLETMVFLEGTAPDKALLEEMAWKLHEADLRGNAEKAKGRPLPSSVRPKRQSNA